MLNKLKTFVNSKNKRLLTAIYAAPFLAVMSIVLYTVPQISGIRPSELNAIANSPADIVIGQPDMTSNLINQVGYGKTMRYPYGVTTDGSKLILADHGNNRILIYNSVPAANNSAADLVIGQPDMITVTAPPSTTASDKTLNGPWDISVDGSKMIVSDYYNNRLLIYNSVPSSNYASANIVIGQNDMTSISANKGGAISASSIYRPKGIFMSGGKIFVCDNGNNRVLIYNSIPTGSGASADIVVGQASKESGAANRGGAAAANTLNAPTDVFYYGSKLYISDGANKRLLIYNTIPTMDGMSADVIISQGTYSPQSIFTDGSKFILTRGGNTTNQTVAFYNTLPATSTATADFYMTGLYEPYGVLILDNKLIISDNGNHRMLIYNSIPTSASATADVVAGQADMTKTSINRSTDSISANTIYHPTGVFKYGEKLLISEQSNCRVLIYNSVPTSNNAAADVEIGQPDMTSTGSNTGGISAKTLSAPRSAFFDGSKLFVPDTSNNRVLIYNGIPAASNTAADVVIGQETFVANEANHGGLSARSLNMPIAVFSTGTKLLISDYNNNRVLIYNTIPTTNYAAADIVIGQPDFTSATDNNGGVSAKSLWSPGRSFSDGTKLFISDYRNNRVLIYNTIPTTNYAAADIVIGQPDMASNSDNQGGAVSSRTYFRPVGVWGASGRLFVSDQYNYRVLAYNTVPTTNNAAADIVVGQPDMTSSSVNQGYNLSASTLNAPTGLYCDSQQLFVTDYTNNRVLIYNLTTTKPVISDIKFNDVLYKSGDTINTLPILKATLTDTGGVGGIYINNLKITIDSTLYTYASFDASTDSYDSASGLMTFKTKTALAAGTHSFKIEISDYLGNWGTWEATDLVVKASTDVAVEGTPLAYPNPVKPSIQSAKITYTLTTDHDVSVYLFNMQGSLIWKRDYSSGSMGGKAGYNEVEWSGRDDFNAQVGNGIYLFRIVSGGKIIGKGKIAVIE